MTFWLLVASLGTGIAVGFAAGVLFGFAIAAEPNRRVYG